MLVLCELAKAEENEVDSRHDYSWMTGATVSWVRYFVAGEEEVDLARDYLSDDWGVQRLESNANAVTVDDHANYFRDVKRWLLDEILEWRKQGMCWRARCRASSFDYEGCWDEGQVSWPRHDHLQ